MVYGTKKWCDRDYGICFAEHRETANRSLLFSFIFFKFGKTKSRAI
jgi:hypothetical protein